MGKEKNKVISRPHLILCEGEDTTQFAICYLEHLQKRDTIFESFVAVDFGGNEELSIFLSDLQQYPGFDIVESMIIIRDSEADHNSAIQSVKSALAKSEFPVPAEPNTIAQNNAIKVAFSLFPSLSKSDRRGTLEDLIIENLMEDRVESLLHDIYLFLEDLKSNGRDFKWPHKTKLHTYFSVTDNFVSNKIGQAVKAGAFNYECSEMNSLKELLRNIALK